MKTTNVGISMEGFKILNDFVSSLNKKSRKSIGRSQVVEYAVKKLSESDIPKIQDLYYRPTDKFEALLEELNAANPERQITKDDFLGDLLETFQKQAKGKAK